MRKRVLSLLAGLALALGIIVAVQAPAQANFSDCPNGLVCAWTGAGATGSMATISYSGFHGQCWNSVTFARHSVYNRLGSGKYAFIYTSFGCVGNNLLQALSPNSSWSDSSTAVWSVFIEN